MKAIQLNELSIARNTFSWKHDGLLPGQLGGKIVFGNADGSVVHLSLKPHHIESILAVVADSMLETTNELVNNLTRDIIEHAGAQQQIVFDGAPTT